MTITKHVIGPGLSGAGNRRRPQRHYVIAELSAKKWADASYSSVPYVTFGWLMHTTTRMSLVFMVLHV